MKHIWNRKIPTLFAILLIIVGVFVTSYSVQVGMKYLIGAAPSENPQDVRITNITDTSFSVTYITDAKVLGTVSFGQQKDSLQTTLDDRDQTSGIPQEYTVHSITVKNLKPQTNYIFSITSGTTTYLNHDNYFSVKTAPTVDSSPSSQKPLSGKVTFPDTSSSEALIFVTTAQGQTLSGIVKSDGVFIIPLNAFRTNDLSKFFDFGPATIMQLLLTNGSITSQVTVSLAVNPIPTIILGSNYDFTTSTTPLASSSAQIGFPAFQTDESLQATPIIITPKKDESFSDTQPQFTGKALPNQTVTIEIHSSDVVSATVNTDSSGRWSYRPSTPLSPGQHIISITTKDATGILRTIEQSFTVFAAGTQVTQSATPSAQPTVSIPTPTRSLPTPTFVIPKLPTTTIAPSPTIISTKGGITATPTPIKSQLPPTGSNSLLYATITGLATTTVGIVLFLLTRGASL